MSADDVQELDAEGDVGKFNSRDEGSHEDEHEALHVIKVDALSTVEHIPVLVR